MKLTNISIQNLFGVQHVSVDLTTPVTLFAGQNGAGKSSIQNAVRLVVSLMDLEMAERLHESLASEKWHKEIAEGALLSVQAENDALRRRVAECEQALVNAAAWLEADTNEIARDILSGLCDSNDIYESTAHCIEKIIAPVLANQIEAGK